MRVVASIEARMGSSRLPGKVLKDVNGLPALTRLLRRLRMCERLDDVVLATTSGENDNALADWASKNDVLCYRGSEEDVLNRVVEAHRLANSDIVVEICGDCILTDSQLVDLCIDTFFENECDVATSMRKRAFPVGTGAQVFRLSDLEEVERTINDPAVREHVSLYFYEHPERYMIVHVWPFRRWFAPNLRFQLDYIEDLQFINEVYRRLEPEFGDTFGVIEIMNLLRAHPTLSEINRSCVEKVVR